MSGAFDLTHSPASDRLSESVLEWLGKDALSTRAAEITDKGGTDAALLFPVLRKCGKAPKECLGPG